jgi:alkanesulfonate monooxygenase SsuD/methylene tetrahydromethanopterin reductase-like flavin-dependent oxidoreductase (luciferase family)
MGTRDVNFYLELAGRYGFGPEATRVQSLYMQGKKREAADAVPHELVEGTCLIGSETEVWSRLQAYVRAGVTVLNVVPAGETLHERLAHFRGARSLIGQTEPQTRC